jgi:putative ABC transport system ATP-binding protein
MSIYIKDLTLQFKIGDSFHTILDIPEWELKPSLQTVIYGPSGSGKSTLLHVIAGLITPSTGIVDVCGQRISEFGEVRRDRFRAKHIGYIFQSFNLLQGYTAIENVMLGMSFSKEKCSRDTARSLLSKMGLSHRINQYPSGLSIGEQQRVAIARAIARKPDIILADEPTGSLDAKNTGEITEMLKNVCRESNCALVVVSHENDVINDFDNKVPFEQLNKAYKKEA